MRTSATPISGRDKRNCGDRNEHKKFATAIKMNLRRGDCADSIFTSSRDSLNRGAKSDQNSAVTLYDDDALGAL
jgi:hypothetical protein